MRVFQQQTKLPIFWLVTSCKWIVATIFERQAVRIGKLLTLSAITAIICQTHDIALLCTGLINIENHMHLSTCLDMKPRQSMCKLNAMS